MSKYYMLQLSTGSSYKEHLLVDKKVTFAGLLLKILWIVGLKYDPTHLYVYKLPGANITHPEALDLYNKSYDATIVRLVDKVCDGTKMILVYDFGDEHKYPIKVVRNMV